MIFLVSAGATFLAFLIYLLGWGPFADPVSIPVTGVVAMCAIGVMGRFMPPVRSALISMVPRALPRPDLLVWLTGALELAGGIGLLIEPLRLLAAAGLALLLVVVFPANVVDARQRGRVDGSFKRRILIRGAEQVFFLALCVWILVATLVA